MDAGHLRLVAGQPPVDLVAPRFQQVLSGCVHPWPGLTGNRQPTQLLIVGNRPNLGNARGLRRG